MTPGVTDSKELLEKKNHAVLFCIQGRLVKVWIQIKVWNFSFILTRCLVEKSWVLNINQEYLILTLYNCCTLWRGTWHFVHPRGKMQPEAKPRVLINISLKLLVWKQITRHFSLYKSFKKSFHLWLNLLSWQQQFYSCLLYLWLCKP